MIRLRSGLLLLAGIAASTSGCGGGLMQDQQAVVVRFDEGSRGLTCLFLYQGLHVDEVGTTDDQQAKNLDDAKRQLADFVASGRKFGMFLFARIDSIDLGKESEGDPATAAIARRFADAIRIENRGFFLDHAKGLCLEQVLAVEDRDEFVKVCNEGLCRAFDGAMTRELAKPDAETKGVQLSKSAQLALQAAARADHRWLSIAPGKIELRFPVSPEDAASFLEQLKSSPRPDERALIPMLEGAIENFRVEAGPDGLTISMGDGRKRTIAIRQGAEEKKGSRREAELIEFARTLKIPFDRTPDVESLIRTFTAK